MQMKILIHKCFFFCFVYRTFKLTDDFVGIFKNRTPQLLILSPQLARRIYVSDFKHFHDNEQAALVKICVNLFVWRVRGIFN